MSKLFLHQLPNVEQLFKIVGQENNILSELIEKDYWLVHTFIFPNEIVKAIYTEKYQEKAFLYYEEQPPFKKILEKIWEYLDIL